MRPLLVILICAGCTTPTPPKPEPKPDDTRTRAYRELSTFAGEAPRRGALSITPQSVELLIRRGEATAPLLTIERGKVDLACWRPPARDEHVEETAQDVWWLFANEHDAVALQLTAADAAAWFWDDERSCAVRLTIIKRPSFKSATPEQYYESDDAQIAYRWNYGTATPNTPARTTLEGDELADILPDVDGQERLVAEPDLIALQAADGHSLLHETFEVDPLWPCFNSQLTIFRKPDARLYAITTFETFGNTANCDQPGGDRRYLNAILEWNPNSQTFDKTHQVLDQLRPLDPQGEDTLAEILIHSAVSGGTLVTVWRSASRYVQSMRPICDDFDAGSGVCLAPDECRSWEATADRQAQFELLGPDGVRIDLGSAQAGSRERNDDCGSPDP